MCNTRSYRSVLLQFVLQAQPTLYSSIIKLSALMCRKVKGLYRQFLWGYNREVEVKRALVRWEVLCRPKGKRRTRISSLVDTNSYLKKCGTEIDPALIHCLKIIQNDISWNLEVEEISKYVTLRDLVVNEHQRAPPNTKLIIAEFRNMKISTIEVLWTRR